MSGHTTVSFEVSDIASEHAGASLRGTDLNPGRYLELLDQLVKVEWLDLKATQITPIYREAVTDLIAALVQTVEYVGPPTLPATAGWSWFDALAKYAPDVAAKFRAAWGKPEDRAVTSAPDAEWPLGGHPAHESWRKDGTATDFEQYAKGWDACLKSLITEVELVATIGERPSGGASEADKVLYAESPITHATQSILRWLTKKVFDDGR